MAPSPRSDPDTRFWPLQVFQGKGLTGRLGGHACSPLPCGRAFEGPATLEQNALGLDRGLTVFSAFSAPAASMRPGKQGSPAYVCFRGFQGVQSRATHDNNRRSCSSRGELAQLQLLATLKSRQFKDPHLLLDPISPRSHQLGGLKREQFSLFQLIMGSKDKVSEWISHKDWISQTHLGKACELVSCLSRWALSV